ASPKALLKLGQQRLHQLLDVVVVGAAGDDHRHLALADGEVVLVDEEFDRRGVGLVAPTGDLVDVDVAGLEAVADDAEGLRADVAVQLHGLEDAPALGVVEVTDGATRPLADVRADELQAQRLAHQVEAGGAAIGGGARRRRRARLVAVTAATTAGPAGQGEDEERDDREESV